MQALGGDCWPSEGADDKLMRPSPTLELWNELVPLRMPQCLRYSLLAFMQKRGVALLLADEGTMHEAVLSDKPHS